VEPPPDGTSPREGPPSLAAGPLGGLPPWPPALGALGGGAGAKGPAL